MKLAIITGAAKGIGKAIALKFAKEGYNIAITTLKSIDELNETKKEIINMGLSCYAKKCDVSDFKELEEFFYELSKEYTKIDVLVNNAGISHIGLLQDMSINEWDKLLNTNLSSIFYTSKLAIPFMLKQGYGSIINISSIWGNVGASMEVAYSSSKGGMNTFTKALAKELAPSNIQVNAIAAGLIDTDMNSFLDKEDKKILLDEIPSGRMGKCEEVAELAFTLAKKDSYITGQVIGIDGAW